MARESKRNFGVIDPKTEKRSGGRSKRRPSASLRFERNSSGKRKAKLRYHRDKREDNEDENVGTESMFKAVDAAEETAYAVKHAFDNKHSKKMTDKKCTNSAQDGINDHLRKMVKNQQVKAGNRDGHKLTSDGGSSMFTKIKESMSGMRDDLLSYVTERPQRLLVICLLAAVLLLFGGSLSSCSAFMPSGSGVIIATTYTAEDEDIIGANDDYKALESGLLSRLGSIERSMPGFDEYVFSQDEIGHDPYQLASYLTVMYEDYTRDEVQDTLRRLFALQYDFSTEIVVETRYRTEEVTGVNTITDPETGATTQEEYTEQVEVAYEYRILKVTLTNHNLGHVITESGGMDEDQAERYAILLSTKGNKEYLFEDDPYVARSSDYLHYDIPGEALTDERFANMIREAEKYLGYPYVWGGSTPETSFDCSGFVSYVINHCGNGWNVGRMTAESLRQHCSIIRSSEARPGDLIFFQGTYNTSGASHVGIYVGNGMMIHCGNPISYASIETAYWQAHFYCFGRIPD